MNSLTGRRHDNYYSSVHLDSKPNEGQYQAGNYKPTQDCGFQSGTMRVDQDVPIQSGGYVPQQDFGYHAGGMVPPPVGQPAFVSPPVMVYQPVLVGSQAPPPQTYQPQKQGPKDPLQNKIDHLSPIPSKKNRIITCLIIGMAISIVVIVLGELYIAYVQKAFGALTLGFGIASLVGFGYGLFAVPYYIKRIQKFLDKPDIEDAEKIDQSCQRIALNIFYYVVMFCFLGFLVIGIGSVAFKDDVKLQIKAMAYNQTEWDKNYAGKDYNSVMDTFDIKMYTLGGICVAYSVFIIFIISVSFSLLNLYRQWQTIVEYVSVLFFQLSLVCIYFSVWVYRLKYVSETSSSLHTWVLAALIACAVIALAVGFIGFFASFLENMTFLKVSKYVSVVYMVFILVIVIFGIVYICNLENFENAKCDSLFLYFEESYLKSHFSCERKYVFVSEEVPSDSCPKNRITFAWEYEKDTPEESKVYGCIDQNCCFNSYSFIRSKYDYLILIGAGLFALGILVCAGSHAMLKRLLKKKEEGISDKKTFRIMGIAAIITAIVIIIIIALLIPGFSKRAYITKAKVDKVDDSDTKINSTSIFQPSKDDIDKGLEKSNEEIKNEMKNTINKTEIPIPKVYDYTVTMDSGVTGTFVSTFPSSASPSDKSTTPPSYGFKGQIELLKTFPDYLKFEPTCVLLPAKGKVAAKETDDTEIYSQEIDYSKVYDKPMKIIGKVNGKLESQDKGQGGKLELKQSTFTSCQTSYTITVPAEDIDSDTTVFYGLKSNIPVEYDYTFTPNDSTNFEDYKSKVNIGGFAADSIVLEINLVRKIPPVKYGTFKGAVLNALTNKNLSDVTVSLYDGTIEFSQEQMTSTKSVTELFGTPKNSKKTDKGGQYSFDSTVIGPYTLIFTKDGFLTDKLLINLEEGPNKLSTVSLSPKLQEGNIRVVLSWIDKPRDLDIHSLFQISSSRKCHVFYGNKNCVGLSLDVDNTKGGQYGVETITFKELGKYIYTFFVHQYSDESRGVARGENAISGVVQSTFPDDGTKTLKLSGAKISIYGYGYNAPISTIQVSAVNEGDVNSRYWIPFCLNGEKGITSLKVINKLQKTIPTSAYCESYYK